MTWIAVLFFPIALASITVPSSISADAMRRSQTINDRITSALRCEPVGDQAAAVGFRHRVPPVRQLVRCRRPTREHRDDQRRSGSRCSIPRTPGWASRSTTPCSPAATTACGTGSSTATGSTGGSKSSVTSNATTPGAVTNLLGMTQDISQLVQIDEQLTQLDSIVDNLGVGVTIGRAHRSRRSALAHRRVREPDVSRVRTRDRTSGPPARRLQPGGVRHHPPSWSRLRDRRGRRRWRAEVHPRRTHPHRGRGAPVLDGDQRAPEPPRRHSCCKT